MWVQDPEPVPYAVRQRHQELQARVLLALPVQCRRIAVPTAVCLTPAAPSTTVSPSAAAILPVAADSAAADSAAAVAAAVAAPAVWVAVMAAVVAGDTCMTT